jgi:hypothetical protein
VAIRINDKTCGRIGVNQNRSHAVTHASHQDCDASARDVADDAFASIAAKR